MGIINTNEPDTSNLSDIPVGLYYYYIDKSKINEASYLGWVDTVQSVTYNPFIEEKDLSLYKANFDTDRYGKPNGSIPNCYRIATNNVIEKILGEIKIFPLKTELNYLQEIKTYLYPFRYFLITDYINTPLIIKPQLVNSNDNTIIIKVFTAPISQEGKYNIFVDNYKNDAYGNLEGIINNTSLMLPVSSSAYSQFLATSSTSFTQGNINAMLENDVTLKQGLKTNQLSQTQNVVSTGLGLLGNVLTGNLGGALSTASNGMFNAMNLYNQSEFLTENHSLKENAIATMTNAKITDMLTTPKTLKTLGNDTIFNLANSRYKIDVIEYGMDSQQTKRVREYFLRYGYAQNNYINIKLNNRKYFTFIKTTICNITGDKIPHKDLNEIREIFNSGITFWNMENNPKFGSYLVDNKEV